MPTKPPGATVSEFIAFAVIDELIRSTMTKEQAAALLSRALTNVRGVNVHVRDQAIPVMEEMLREYAK